MQHLRTVHSWKFRLLQSNLGLLHEERLQKAYSPTLSEFRSSYSAISCKARTNIQASIQSKNLSLSLTVIMVFRENFSSSAHLSGIRIKAHDTHHNFSFDLSYPFPDSRDTTRSGTTISSHLLLHKPYSFPGHPAHQSTFALPFISLPIRRAPIIPNRSQHMLAQDRVDLLRLHG